MFINIEHWKNGDSFTEVVKFGCNICEDLFYECDPHISNENTDTHICSNCIINNIAICFEGSGLSPEIIIHHLFDKYVREKPKRYIAQHIRRRLLSDDAECIKCRSTHDLTIDHVNPVAKGGTSDLDNLQVLCRKCNSAKGVNDNYKFMKS